MKAYEPQPSRSVANRFEMTVDGAISMVAQIDPFVAWLTSAFSVALIGLVDYITGTGIWFGPIYICIVCFSTWILRARAGIAIGLACFSAGLFANGASVYPYHRTEIVLNVGMRLLAMVVVVMLIAAFRRSHDREWHSARIDHLTGAMTGAALLEQASRSASSAGVVAYLDLDGFKGINDRFGHAAGDEVLRSFAKQVSGQLGRNDLFARLGGDEFLIYLPQADASDVQSAIESLHKRLNNSVSWEGHPIGCSIGAVLVPAGCRIGESDVAEADRLMYLAKRDRSGLCFRSSGSQIEAASTARGRNFRLLIKLPRWNRQPTRSNAYCLDGCGTETNGRTPGTQTF
ncbi:MAG: diguanylate cyclase [Sphingomonadales bacterium]|nr:diguanylate cyclase [Sphingomonadales bacterium]